MVRLFRIIGLSDPERKLEQCPKRLGLHWCYYMQYYMRMVQRHFWQRLVEQNWRERSVVWLAGVRRVGKTFLCQSLKDIEYFDCELPRMRRMMEDAQAFLEGLGKRRIVLDEVHRLPNPSELLKIAADHYPNIRVAIASSTLGASAKGLRKNNSAFSRVQSGRIV